VPPWPLEGRNQLAGQRVLPGLDRVRKNSGRNPPIKASKSSAGEVRASGIVSPGLSFVVLPAPSTSAR